MTPAEFQHAVAARCDVLQYRKGERIYDAGDETGGLFGIVEGRLEMHMPSKDGRPTLSYVTGPGFWTGDLAALTARRRRITIMAGSDCTLLRLSRAAMMSITDSQPGAWRSFAVLSAINLAVALDVIEAMRCTDPVDRVAATLFNLAFSNPGATHPIEISQAELGALTRLSRSAVNRAIGNLEARRLVRVAYGRIEIIDAKKFAAFVRGE
jgi:CRP/FNR family transcriptional regulator, cyclic AMP receptor protein